MTFTFTPQSEYSATTAFLRAIFGWIMLIPHFLYLIILGIGAFFISIYSFFVLVFTGKYSDFCFDYFHNYTVYSTRILIYMFGFNDTYPSFEFGKSEDDNFSIKIQKKENYSRGLTIIIAWFGYILLIPHLIIWYLLGTIISTVSYLGFWYVIITGRFPKSFISIFEDTIRLLLKINYYALNMDQKYPSIDLES
jgi:hypothetical protein